MYGSEIKQRKNKTRMIRQRQSLGGGGHWALSWAELCVYHITYTGRHTFCRCTYILTERRIEKTWQIDFLLCSVMLDFVSITCVAFVSSLLQFQSQSLLHVLISSTKHRAIKCSSWSFNEYDWILSWSESDSYWWFSCHRRIPTEDVEYSDRITSNIKKYNDMSMN